MKLYITKNHITLSGVAISAIGSILMGLVIGVLAYFLSNLIYYFVVFPLVIGVFATFAYLKLLHWSKVRHAALSGMLGMAVGLSIAAGFYGTPYWIERQNVIRDFQNEYQISPQTASDAFDSILEDLTGSRGFFGYMKFKAEEGEEFTHYFVFNSIPVSTGSLLIQSSGAWIYWITESILFCVACVWFGVDKGRRQDFNFNANDWYDTPTTQIGTARLEEKDNLLISFLASDLTRLGELISAEDAQSHPQIEIYIQSSKNKKGETLLSVKETYRKNATTVSCKLLHQWEIPKAEIAILMEALSRRKA